MFANANVVNAQSGDAYQSTHLKYFLYQGVNKWLQGKSVNNFTRFAKTVFK